MQSGAKGKKRGATALQRVTPASVLSGFRGTLVYIFVLSGIINLLALTGALYMLQIYDRTLVSHSIPTLLALSGLAIGLYLFQGFLDVIRSQILVRLGAHIDGSLAPLAHRVTIDMPRFGFQPAEAIERGRDVDTLRQFFGSQGPVALYDLPWMPIYLAFIYILHPWLGLMVLGGAVILAGLTIAAEILTRQLNQKTRQAALLRESMIDAHSRNSEVLRAMGFTGHAVARYTKANAEHLRLQTQSSDISGSFSGYAKVLRMVLQSAILGLGAFLAIQGELSAGAIVAASIVSGRALAPVDQALAQWKNVVAARRSYSRLADTLTVLDEKPMQVKLPAPKASMTLEKVTVATPSGGTVVVSEVSMTLQAGQALGLIGPSGSGKSSLVRALTGVWPVLRGSVRLDGAEIGQWQADDLGSFIGYLPQDVSLFDATIAENICRLDPEPNSDRIISAAMTAGVHEMIVRLPEGYQTQLGPNGLALSGGQRQRIALARALYGNPFLVVLDEPNSNLDAEGDAALTEAIRKVRERGGIAIVVAHRPSALTAVDMVAIMQGGRLTAFGPKDEVLQSQFQPRPVATQPTVKSA